MSNSATLLDLITSAQAQKEVTANALFDAASPAMLYGRRARFCEALTWAYYGGAVLVAGTPLFVASGTLTLAANATNYIEADPVTGAVASNTTGFTGGKTPLYSVVTGAATVTSYADWRTGSAGTITSVNGQAGPAVNLNAADVGADAAGAAADAIAAHLAAGNPHGQYLTEAEADALYAPLGSSGSASGLDFDTDGTLAANSDAKIATQKAVKTYCDQLLAAADAMVFKGTLACAANPNYPAASAGHAYRVSSAGKVGGASGVNVEVGDLLMCLVDGTSAGTQAAVGSAWTITQTNLDGAVIGPASSSDGGLAVFDGASGKLLKGASLSAVLDLVGSAAQGDILVRGAAGWQRLAAGTAGQFLRSAGAGADPGWASEPFDVAAFYPGKPTASAYVLRVPVARAVAFAASLAGSSAQAGTAATASTVFDVQKNGASIGAITFAAGASVATFASTGGAAQALAAGDVLAIVAPVAPDATLADIGFALAGSR